MRYQISGAQGALEEANTALIYLFPPTIVSPGTTTKAKHNVKKEKQSQKEACHFRCDGGREGPLKFAFPSVGEGRGLEREERRGRNRILPN